MYDYCTDSNINNVIEENLSDVDINEVKKIVDNKKKEEEELFRRNMSKLEFKGKQDNENEDNNINLFQKDETVEKNIIDENMDKIECKELNTYEE
jgi:hypothetical protein